jgi:uncharacterized protein
MLAMNATARPGSITWADLTVEEADKIRDFYQAVTGWTSTPLSMGAYSDFLMNDGGGEAVAGICHGRGPNADLPPVWLVYITVDDLDHSLQECQRLGGALLRHQGPRRRHLRAVPALRRRLANRHRFASSNVFGYNANRYI